MYLYDFYSISLKYNRATSTREQDNAIRVYLEEVKESLLKDIRYCVYRELRHAGTFALRTLFKEYNATYSRWGTLTKRGLESTLRKSKGMYFVKAEKVFTKSHWAPAYGGKKWAKIANLARKLELDNFQDLGNSLVLIDRLIDAAHNTGRCLDKIYPDINTWLNKKRYSKKTDWIIRGSNRQIRHIFR